MTYGNYPDLSQVKRILVIKMRHHGDVLLTAPLFSQLKKAVPGAQIDAFIYADTLPMLEGHPAISHFFLYDKRWKKKSLWGRLKEELKLFWAIRSKRYDLVFNLTEGDRGALATVASRAKWRVGSAVSKKKGLLDPKRLYTHRVKVGPHPRHTVEKHLDFVRAVGIFPEADERKIDLYIPPEAFDRVDALLAEKGFKRGEYILIHPVSRWRFKCLSVAQMAELLQALHKKGLPLAVSAGPESQEKEMTEQIAALCPEVPFLNLAGKLSLKELCALIAASKALICVDSVPLHIASATKTPLVALFGPTSEVNWGPWKHPKAQVVTRPFSCRPCYQDGCGGSKMSDCLFSMPIDQIIEALDKVL